MKIIYKTRIYFLRFLKKIINIYYKNVFLKILYGMISPNPLQDPFARKNGIIELLNAKKILKINNPICNEFIISRFKRYAEKYDVKVQESGYISRELSKCAEIIKNYSHELKKIKKFEKIKILDLGCGTGLLGSKISDLNVLLNGVDISEPMLIICKRKNLYQNLYCDDLITFLEKSEVKYDMITASSVIPFFYPEKLSRLMELVANHLSLEGCFIFSFDICQKEYKINEKLFCEHSENLIKKISRKYFQFCKIDLIDNSRIESKKIVKGAICVCTNSLKVNLSKFIEKTLR